VSNDPRIPLRSMANFPIGRPGLLCMPKTLSHGKRSSVLRWDLTAEIGKLAADYSEVRCSSKPSSG
jgi:hypothetical protein